MLASNADKQVQGNRPVIHYLIRECRYCGGVMKVQLMRGKVIHLEGCVQISLFKPHRESGRMVIFASSHKTVRCTNHRKGNPLAQCNRNAQVGRFQEIFP